MAEKDKHDLRLEFWPDLLAGMSIEPEGSELLLAPLRTALELDLLPENHGWLVKHPDIGIAGAMFWRHATGFTFPLFIAAEGSLKPEQAARELWTWDQTYRCGRWPPLWITPRRLDPEKWKSTIVKVKPKRKPLTTQQKLERYERYAQKCREQLEKDQNGS